MNQAGRYQILEELGRGATGVVYRATDPASDKTIALKSVRLAGIGGAEEKRVLRDGLLSEARSAAILSHPNIAAIYDVFESEEQAYIAMEYVDGASLEQRVRAGTLPERRKLLLLLRQIAEALDYAHRKGIVHRDIKPANIIISGYESGAGQVAKMVDFGVSAFASSEVTQNGTLAGAPSYMSPEQIQGLAVGGKADQFSFAVVVYELLCGAKPFTGENLQGLLYSICKQNPKPVEQLNPRLTETVDKVVARALAKEPEQRFSSCRDFIAALSFALDECPEWMPVASMEQTKVAPVFPTEPPPIRREDRVKPAAAILVTSTGGALPGRERTARRSEAAEIARKNSRGKRFGLIVALCFAVVAAIIFTVRWNSGSPTPVQVLDPNAGKSTPPPLEIKPADVKPVAKESQSPSTEAAAPPPVENLQPPAPTPAEAAPTTPLPAAPAPKEGPTQPDVALAKTDVELVTDPPGGKVVVDSHQSCLSPCSVSLAAGRHTLTAELSGYTVAQKIIQVPDETNVFLPLVRSVGVLVVSSEPSGSQVTVDGKNYGPTPVTLHLPAGSHHLTISDGDRSHDETIEIDGDGVHSRTFRW